MLQFYIPEVKSVEQVSYFHLRYILFEIVYFFRRKMTLIKQQRKNSKNLKKNFMMKTRKRKQNLPQTNKPFFLYYSSQ